MIGKLLLPGLLDTGRVCDRLVAVRDGLMDFYVVEAPAGLICIDAGWCATRILRAFRALGLAAQDVAAVLLTHLHWDHARCWALYPDAQVFVGECEVPSPFARQAETPRPWVRVRGGRTIAVAGLPVEVIDTPGHTAGSLSYVVDGRLLFTGDTLRLQRGRVLPFLSCLNQDNGALANSIRKLSGIDGVERLLTAHSGTARDLARAFSLWRECPTTPSRQEGDGP